MDMWHATLQHETHDFISVELRPQPTGPASEPVDYKILEIISSVYEM